MNLEYGLTTRTLLLLWYVGIHYTIVQIYILHPRDKEGGDSQTAGHIAEMSCSSPCTDRASREYPLNQPEGWKAKYPRWTLQLPAHIDHVTVSYIGVQPREAILYEKGVFPNLHPHTITENQRKAASMVEAWLTHDSGTDAPELWEKFYVETGYDVPDTEVWVLYWTDKLTAGSAMQKLDLQQVSCLSSTDNAALVGVWRETFTVPKTRLETIYSGNDYRPGIASLKDAIQVSHNFTGYWGAARDRIPASAHTQFAPQFPAPAPNFNKDTVSRALRGYNKDIVLHIRSGQYWEKCSEAEREAYERLLEPVLREGMAYLEDNASESGDFGLRFMRNIVSNHVLTEGSTFLTGRSTNRLLLNSHYNSCALSEKRLETCSAGFFRSLKDLESWAAHHRTHRRIFHGVHAHSSRFGKESYEVRTWHEVSILRPGEVKFEYINCSPRTGLIPFVNT